MRGLDKTKCPVCRSVAEITVLTTTGPDLYRVKCLRCGLFKITGTFSAMLGGPYRDTELSEDRISNLSSYIRENPNQLISEQDVDFIRRLSSPSVGEKATKLLRYVARQHPYAGEEFTVQWDKLEPVLLSFENPLPMFTEDALKEYAFLLSCFAASWSRNAEEFIFILAGYLTDNRRFLAAGATPQVLHITPAGWDYLHSLEMPSSESQGAFVAMWFNVATESLWKEAIRPGVYNAGYEPIRIDAVEHANRIDDEIIARIRACKFLVADFTANRGGVYFEAGFALGLGKRVIWCVKDTDLKEVHFDTRQYNFLRWNPDDLPSLREALTNRIEALFGKGLVRLDTEAGH